jgi:CHAP domain-containing protein
MSIEATLARVSAIKQALADPAMLVGSGGVSTGGTEAPATPTAGAQSSFASALAQASTPQAAAEEPPGAAASALADAPTALAGSPALSSLEAAGQNSPGARMVAIAESQLGQTEQPPGSNESPAIAQYRSATAGAIPGAPWCAYFASWVARQAGEPIGANGEGAGAVSEVWSWAQSTGRAIPNGPGVVPQPGDLIVFGDEHVGIVRDVLPDGQIQTIEGNYENKVAANVRSPTEATGYVNMG